MDEHIEIVPQVYRNLLLFCQQQNTDRACHVETHRLGFRTSQPIIQEDAPDVQLTSQHDRFGFTEIEFINQRVHGDSTLNSSAL